MLSFLILILFVCTLVRLSKDDHYIVIPYGTEFTVVHAASYIPYTGKAKVFPTAEAALTWSTTQGITASLY